ncbi:hypothetical protein BLNAU_3587 [Blattamonas nauphoetae]|uniref:Uncharacterized protein n=1 Tax=Blattamonas nauphoetae TaxID=2049346 RepID=A0ABQ9YCI0_9EUKA|nr:hypothetical protein BLNAU_3587 [Blattamonas nauphoetae]
MALQQLPKFDILLPRWYEITFMDYVDFVSEPHFNDTWLKKERQIEASLDPHFTAPKIIPSFRLTDWTAFDFVDFLHSKNNKNLFIDGLIRECELHVFDGVHLDLGHLLWMTVTESQTDQQSFSSNTKACIAFFQILAKELHEHDLRFYLSIAYPTFFSSFGNPRFPIVIPQVLFSDRSLDGLFIDPFTNPLLRSGPLSYSAQTLHHTIDAVLQDTRIAHLLDYTATDAMPTEKIFVGIAFSGQDTSRGRARGTVRGPDYLHILKHYKTELAYDESVGFTALKYTSSPSFCLKNGTQLERSVHLPVSTEKEQHICYFPTIDTLHDQLQVLQQKQLNVAVYDLGDGLDYFMDLF